MNKNSFTCENKRISIVQAEKGQVLLVHKLICETIHEVYTKYYADEMVDFFIRMYNQESIADEIEMKMVYLLVLGKEVIGTGTIKENHIKRVFVHPKYQRTGMGNILVEHLENIITQKYGSVWIETSLSAVGFYHQRGYVVQKYREHTVENEKILLYAIMCKKNFKINPQEFDAPSVLVKRELELQGYSLDKMAMPKRVYLLADSLYDTMLSRNVGTLTYPVGGDLYVMNDNKQIGFVKGEMCSPGIATQAEDLIAGGVEELIHVGFAGGLTKCGIGDIVVTDGAYNDTGVAGLYGFNEGIVSSSKSLTDEVCEEMQRKNISYIRGKHWTTDAGYVQPHWRTKDFMEKGAICVEMEGAGLFTVAAFRAKRATAIYVISDTGSNDDWNLGWGENVLEKTIDRIIDAIADR